MSDGLFDPAVTQMCLSVGSVNSSFGFHKLKDTE